MPELPQVEVAARNPLRARLAYDGPLLGAVCRIFVDSVLGWYRRRMEIEGAVGGRGGVVTVVQRTSADLKLNPHLHSVFMDGVFVAGPEGGDCKPVFQTLPRISDTAVGICTPFVSITDRSGGGLTWARYSLE